MSVSVDALRLQERAQDLVRRARIDVVGAEQHPALGAAAFLAHQVLDRGNRLLVRRGAGVEHVLRQLLAFVLHRIEQQAVQLLEHRQHRLARHRLVQQPNTTATLSCEISWRAFSANSGQFDAGSTTTGLELLAHHAALGVDLVDRHQRHVLQHRFADRHRAGQRVEHADLDRASAASACVPTVRPASASAADSANRFRTVLRCMDFPVSNGLTMTAPGVRDRLHAGPRNAASHDPCHALERRT